MPKYKRTIVLMSIIGVMATSMIGVITSCSLADAQVEQKKSEAEKVKGENTIDEKIQDKWIRQEMERHQLQAEVDIVSNFCDICIAQDEFKKRKVKDQNKNGIGEYASNTELIDFIKAEKEKKNEVIKRLLPFYPTDYIGKEGNLFEIGFCYRVFIPEEPEMQEQYWLARVLRNPEGLPPGIFVAKRNRSYFYYNKMEMIFYTDWNLPELFSRYKEQEGYEVYKDPWTLRTIFFGEPFKSPINTALWKALDDSNHFLLRFRYR